VKLVPFTLHWVTVEPVHVSAFGSHTTSTQLAPWHVPPSSVQSTSSEKPSPFWAQTRKVDPLSLQLALSGSQVHGVQLAAPSFSAQLEPVGHSTGMKSLPCSLH
jgi:hypothetical protein